MFKLKELIKNKIVISLVALIVLVVLLIILFPAKPNSKLNFQVKQDSNTEVAKIKPRQVYKFNDLSRNYKDIQFGDLRKDFDKPYNRLADDLSDAYYNFWKKGKSKPWQGYDVQATPKQSKVLFDKLHGLIWHWYNVNFHRANMARPIDERIPEKEYNYVYGPDGKILYKKSEHSKQIIEELKEQGIEIKIK